MIHQGTFFFSPSLTTTLHVTLYRLWERNWQVAPCCFTHPWVRGNEEASGRSKNLSKITIKKIGYSVKDEVHV